MNNIGLPNIDVIFKGLAKTAITRSQKGVVVLIVKDDTEEFDFVEYQESAKIEAARFTATNKVYIEQCFLGNPSKVIVARIGTADTLVEILAKVLLKKFNWIGIAEGTVLEQQELATWVKTANESDKKTFKAVVHNATTTDDMHVVNFKNASVKPVGAESITGEKYISRLLGLLAGLPFTRSATFYVLADLESVTDLADIEAAINAGGFVLFNDEEVVRVVRAVNSLVTIGDDLTEDMKKITIVEAMDMIIEDIKNTFKNHYIGKYKNTYDNQILFISAVNTYFRILGTEDILDANAVNQALIDVQTQRKAWIDSGKTEALEWSEIEVKVKTFKSNVFLGGQAKILDAMEDLIFNIAI